MLPSIRPTVWVIFICLSYLSQPVSAQKATISEDKIEIETYEFGDPSPIPILAEKPQIYPYHRFDGYSFDKHPVQWKVVTLENDYIKVMVLPEVGGKVWGAVDKRSDFDFIYLNEVLKFRNIALRGPWTSGGIEFNFGYIGHTPSTASPVDYQLRENADGSVSCFVGGLDLPSRTQWRVEVRLAPDKAYFETRVQYYNPTNTSKSYYNWMTAAARTENELEFIYPGDQYLSHGGDAYPWYIDDQGRELNIYENNAFGSNISRHVVGTYADFFGGYYHRDNVGFGHLAPYEEMPGQKLWLWALSRQGGIWEDLLTDTNGQYLEFQAGRMLNQFSGSASHNPIAKAGFGPHTYDSWTDLWFPVKDIGGMVDASSSGVLNVEQNGRELIIGLQSLVAGEPEIQVLQGGVNVYSTKISLAPNETSIEKVKLPTNEPYEVRVFGYDLNYSSTGPDLLDRSFEGMTLEKETVSILYHEGTELKKNRQPTAAMKRFEEVLDEDPYHIGALCSISEILLQEAQYEKALEYIKRALSIDTYDAQSNFIAAAIYQVMQDEINALECYGWAARSMQFRAAAYMEMGGIYLKRSELNKAKNYLSKSLRFNADNLQAKHLLSVIMRKSGERQAVKELLEEIIEIDPLNHLANYELDLVNGDKLTFGQKIKSELKYQSFLEMALWYDRYGMVSEARQILDEAPDHSLILLWRAYLDRANTKKTSSIVESLINTSPEYVFPYRPETLKPLIWLNDETNHWKAKYFLGLNYWALHRLDEAKEFIEACINEPDVPSFYIAKSQLLELMDGAASIDDLERALDLDKDQWRSWNYLMKAYLDQKQYDKAVSSGKTAIKKFPENYELKLKLAEAYLHTGDHQSATNLLNNTHVLPFEGASSGRRLYEQALLFSAIESYEAKKYDQAIQLLEEAREWPERLGVGKPYDPDERIEDYLQAMCLRKLKKDSASNYEQQVIQYTKEHFRGGYRDILGLLLMDPYKANELLASEGIQVASLTDLAKSIEGDLYFDIVEKLSILSE
ncbi:MAG: DUF5107 domain-containing protein [Bacteroidota bacterium]